MDEEGFVVLNVMVVVVANFVVFVNSWVIYFMCSKTRSALIDNMILQDCVANLGGLVSFFLHYPKLVWGSDHWCRFTLLVSTYFILLNRVIPITIAIYRYLLICHDEKIQRFGRTKLARLLNTTNSLVPVVLTIIPLVYAEDVYLYSACLGRKEIFHKDLNNLLGDEDLSFWNKGRFLSLPLYHPARLAYFLTLLTYSLLIPGYYLGIFRFRWKQDRTVEGSQCKHSIP